MTNLQVLAHDKSEFASALAGWLQVVTGTLCFPTFTPTPTACPTPVRLEDPHLSGDACPRKTQRLSRGPTRRPILNP